MDILVSLQPPDNVVIDVTALVLPELELDARGDRLCWKAPVPAGEQGESAISEGSNRVDVHWFRGRGESRRARTSGAGDWNGVHGKTTRFLIC
jgi:hypothetical protein